jgi:C_GCAxxG_C_C family probable redox protein
MKGKQLIMKQKEKEEILERAYRVGFDFEKNNHGCAQATIKAIMEIFDVDPIIFKIASPCSGGLSNGGLGPCGALIGGTLVIGYFFGRGIENQHLSGRQFRDRALMNKLRGIFHEKFNGETCREVQKAVFGHSFDLMTESGRKDFEIEGGHILICPNVVGTAVKWIADILIEEGISFHNKIKEN